MEAETLVETVVRLLVVFWIGQIFLWSGRRLFWLLGGLAMATLCLTIAILVIAFAIIARYPSLLDALGQAIQNPQTNPASSAALPALAEEANKAFENSIPQLGALLLIVTLIGGIVGALILIRLPRVASAIVGFVGGIYLLLLVFDLYSVSLAGWLRGLLAIAAGIFAAIIAWRNPDTSLIVLSTLIGANIIVLGLNFNLNTSFSAIVWLSLMLIGIIFQTYDLRRRQAKIKAKAALARK